MGLRRKRKVEAELIELVRSELAALRAEVQSAMADTAAVLSARVRTEVEQRMGEPSALVAGIQGVRETIAGARLRAGPRARAGGGRPARRWPSGCSSTASNATALVDAISRLTTALRRRRLVRRSPSERRARDGHRRDRRATDADADRRRTRSSPGPSLVDDEPDRRDRPRGHRRGTRAGPAPRAGRPVRPDGVEVRCRFGDRWVTGFEVCEVIRLDDATRYRLRRRSDGSVIPTLFDEKDLRFFSTAFLDPI